MKNAIDWGSIAKFNEYEEFQNLFQNKSAAILHFGPVSNYTDNNINNVMLRNVCSDLGIKVMNAQDYNIDTTTYTLEQVSIYIIIISTNK